MSQNSGDLRTLATSSAQKKPGAKPALTPKLRFPEFRDAQGWEWDTLGSKVTKVGSGITPTGGDINYGSGGRPFVRSQNVGWGELILDDVVFIDDEIHRTFASTEIKLHDVLLNITGASIGRSAVADSRIAGGNVNQHVCIIRSEQQALVPWFLNQYLLSNYGQNQIDSFQAGGNRQGLNFAQIRSFTIPVPPRSTEQRKIAECLSSVDELIAAHARKLDALKTHKKGLMQQLFPREGETQPRLRFPEFQDAGEWEEADFADAIFFQEGPGIMAVDFRDDGIPLVRLSGLNGQTVSLDGCNYLDPDKVQQKWPHFRLEAGDLLVSCSASFGRPAAVTEIAAGAVFYTGLVRFRPKNKRIVVGYLEVFLGSPSFLRQADSFAVGSGIKHFGPSHLRQMKVPLPCPAEQQRIADCLTSLDGLIAAQTQKLEALKTHKKGLMQQLFPSLEEVEA